MRNLQLAPLSLLLLLWVARGFVPILTLPHNFSPSTALDVRRISKESQHRRHTALFVQHMDPHANTETELRADRRREFLSGIVSSAVSMLGFVSSSNSVRADEGGTNQDDFASIAARASQISKQMDVEATTTAVTQRKSDKTAYDFTLPVDGQPVNFADLIRQEISKEDGAKIKAIVVVNIKQDDPVARKTIPELIALATKYGRGSTGSLAVVACPTDQGYYEPDTSTLIRLKLASEYGYGINPSTIVTDKVNLLGTGSHPFWRWLQGTCRTPAGLGRIEGNFEKFLIDGRTGMPMRRYPRKYQPLNMADDIEAVIAGKPLPPARANWQEEWRAAAVEAERDTYRFEKGLNYFDQ